MKIIEISIAIILFVIAVLMVYGAIVVTIYLYQLFKEFKSEDVHNSKVDK